MSEIEITWLGHSCFQVRYNRKTIVFDPYQDGSVPGLTLRKDITADAVYCSHDHADHNAANLIHVTGTGDPFPTKTIRVPHDDENGKKRGMCDIRFVQLGNVTIAHLGDIGRLPAKNEYEELKKADILMIPAGGYFTIDALQAKEIIKNTQPKLSILMHYRNGWGYDVLADIQDIRKAFTDLKEIKESTLLFEETDIPEGVFAMVPLQ